jgi:hypothetical protein
MLKFQYFHHYNNGDAMPRVALLACILFSKKIPEDGSPMSKNVGF